MSGLGIALLPAMSAGPNFVEWLPESLPHSVLRDVFRVRLPSLVQAARRAVGERGLRGKQSVAAEWRGLLAGGEVKSRADLARRAGVTRARVTQVLGPA